MKPGSYLGKLAETTNIRPSEVTNMHMRFSQCTVVHTTNNDDEIPSSICLGPCLKSNALFPPSGILYTINNLQESHT